MLLGELASQLPHDHIIIASDCESLIKKLQSRVTDRSNIGIIIEDIKKVVCTSTVAFSFIHVNRCCNKAAHVLARSADRLSESVWLHVPPEFLWSTLCNDMTA